MGCLNRFRLARTPFYFILSISTKNFSIVTALVLLQIAILDLDNLCALKLSNLFILIYNHHICILLINTNPSVYICYILYDNGVLTVRDSEHNVLDTVEGNEVKCGNFYPYSEGQKSAPYSKCGNFCLYSEEGKSGPNSNCGNFYPYLEE